MLYCQRRGACVNSSCLSGLGLGRPVGSSAHTTDAGVGASGHLDLVSSKAIVARSMLAVVN